jgi:hypothetical protein
VKRALFEERSRGEKHRKICLHFLAAAAAAARHGGRDLASAAAASGAGPRNRRNCFPAV